MSDEQQGLRSAVHIAVDVLIGEKNLLTLTREEYMCLSAEGYSSENTAVRVAATESYGMQLAYVSARLGWAVERLLELAVSKEREESSDEEGRSSRAD